MQSTVVGACNDALLFPRCVEALRGDMEHLSTHEAGALGLAVVVDRQMLLRKRPVAKFQPADLLEDLHSNLFMMAFQPAPVGAFNADLAEPLRYRDWVFSMSGPMPEGLADLGSPIRKSLPSFVEGALIDDDVRSLLFSYFIGGLYEEGLLEAKPEQNRAALIAIAKGMSRFRDLTGMQAVPFSFTMMCRDFAVGFVGEIGVQKLALKGIEAPSDGSVAGLGRRADGLEAYVKKVVLASTTKELPAPWTRLEPSQVFLLGKDGSWASNPAFA